MSNISKEQLNAILETAGKKLGISPDQLRAAMSDPKKAESLLNKIDKHNGGKFNTQDPAALEKIVRNNPKAKKMLDELSRGDRNG